MIRNPREKELPTKQEGSIANDRASTSSRLWSGLRNPRIIRVSRAFGGKDRHSKVTTIRGLRDRRVRLSVPTAIQLYDLQERLGVNQPSKVVDWLLNAAQHEIDKLPPLPMLPGNFIQFSQSLAKPQEVTPPQSPSLPHSVENTGYRTLPKSTYWNADAPQRAIQRGTQRELGTEKGNEVENGIHSAQAQAHDPLLRMSHSSLSSLLSNSMPYNSYCHLEPANAYASHMGIHSSQLELAPTSQMPGSQLVFCPSGANPSMFQPYMTASTEFDARQFSQLQMVSSTMSEFYSNLASKHQHES